MSSANASPPQATRAKRVIVTKTKFLLWPINCIQLNCTPNLKR